MNKLWILGFFLISCSSPQKEKEIPNKVESKKDFIWNLENLDRPFLVQNIATMTIRGYAFPCPNCLPKLIFQAPLVVGKDETGRRSILGSFKIFKWVKFYIDIEKHYLPWNESPIPQKGAERSQWGKKGAFGWYAAILEPNAHSQWLHGTIGWGQEEDRFIVHEKNSNGNWIRIKSKGCSRVSNATISFIQKYFPENTPVLKIYAIEKIFNPNNNNNNNIEKEGIFQWSNNFFNRKNELLESFSVAFKKSPEVIEIKDNWALGEKKVNPYEVPLKDFHGIYWIDIGLIENYKHPKKIIHNYQKMPNFFIFNNHE